MNLALCKICIKGAIVSDDDFSDDEKMAVWMLFTLQEFSATEIDTLIKALQVKLSEADND